MRSSVVCKKEPNNEAHISALSSPQKTHSRFPRAYAHPRWPGGYPRSPCPWPGPPFGLRPGSALGFSKEQKLRRKAQITLVLARGRSAAGGGLQLHSLPNDAGPRLGVIAGRRAWPRAVDRNRFRRLTREIFRQLQHRLQQRDYLVRARNPQRGKPSGAEIGKLFAAWFRTDKEQQA
jgi:ribonuclease P protein component